MSAAIRGHSMPRRRASAGRLTGAAALLGLAGVLRCCGSAAFHFAGGLGLRSGAAPLRTRAGAAPVAAPEGKFTVRYFDGRGVAEVSRMLLAIAETEYEDKRYSISFGTPGDFSTIKREEFDADKAAGRMDVSMGKVPVLEAGDFLLPQSKAIERFLAKKLGMMGGSIEEEAWVDAVAEHVRDINDAYSRKGIFFMKDQEKKAELQAKWFGEELPELLAKLDKALPGADGFAVGGKMSLADVVIFKLLKDTYDRDVSELYAELPKLKAIVESVGENEALKKWMADRPQTMF